MKNQQKFTLFLFLILVVSNSYAQLSSFDLSDYKLPDIERKSLDAQADFSNSSNYYNADDNSSFSYEKSHSSQFDGNMQLSFDNFINSEKYQKNSSLNVQFYNYMYNQFAENQTDYKSNVFRPQLYYSKVNRHYFVENKYFEWDINANYTYGRYKSLYESSTNNSEQKRTEQSHSIGIQVPLLVGKGRIEPVQDARQAVYILSELQKAGRLTKEVNNDGIIQFAELISKLHNERFFDSRLKRMEELIKVDSFLKENKYIDNDDAIYFTTLSDFWDYGNRQVRKSGKRFAFVLRPGYNFYNYNYDQLGYQNDNDTIKYQINSLIVDGGLEYQYHKPISLAWQNGITLNATAGIIECGVNRKTSEFENTVRIPNFQLKFAQSIGFYPNTRTDLTFNYSAHYIQLFDATDIENDINGNKGSILNLSSAINFNYYISPQLRLNISTGLSYFMKDIYGKGSAFSELMQLDGGDYIINNQITGFGVNIGNYDRTFNQTFNIKFVYSIF